MKLQISDRAAEWYIDELELPEGASLRFHARYGGVSTVQKGFSLGIIQEEPEDIAASQTMRSITFYVEEKDTWFFDGHDLLITFNEQSAEPEFVFKKGA